MSADKVADLLKPRWKVIADFPDSDYEIGSIQDRDWTKYVNGEDESDGIVWSISQFPHLFKKLQWWEDRDIKAMPEYMKEEGDIIRKVVWRNGKYRNRDVIKMNDGENDWLCCPGVMEFYQPATEQEYLNYINSKK